MPKAYGYLRVSHRDQAENGNSIETQNRIVLEKFERLKQDIPDLEFAAMFIEQSVSAYTNRFLCRPEGARLNAKLQANDVVIFSRVDRAFRVTSDMLHTVKMWGDRKVGVVFCDFPLETATPMGKMALTIWAAVAEMDSAVKSQRIKEAMKTLKENNRPVNRIVPYGKKVDWSSALGHKVFVDDADDERREIAERVYQIRNEKGIGFSRISDIIEDELAAKEGRKSRRGLQSLYKYSRKRCEKLFKWMASLENSTASD